MRPTHNGSSAQQRLASFSGSRAGEEEREPGTHCSRMHQVPLATCILLRCTKFTINSAYLLKGRTAWLYSFWDSHGRFNNIASTVTVCIASFKAIGELQRKRMRQSRAAVFSWNTRTRGQFLQAKSWVPSSLLRHRPHREHGQGQAPFIWEKSA